MWLFKRKRKTPPACTIECVLRYPSGRIVIYCSCAAKRHVYSNTPDKNRQ